MNKTPDGLAARHFIGWGVFIFLSCLELLAALYARPSVLVQIPFLLVFVQQVGEWIPLVESFSRCAAKLDSGSGLMLALNVVFFPIKLAAVYYAHPKKMQNPDTGLKAVFGTFYVFMIALVALVPTVLWFGGWFAPGDYGLASINNKVNAICHGGTSGFFATFLQGGFAITCAYMSLAIFIGIGRSLKAAISSNL
jgi:hypothetical protein